jgi:hypothetical protein
MGKEGLHHVEPETRITLPILIGLVASGVWRIKRIDDLRSDLREFRAEIRGDVNNRLER